MLRLRTLALLLFAVAFALPAAAQNAALMGTFTYNQAASDNVNTAIDAAVRPMNALLRPIARGRLRSTNQPYRRIVIASQGTQTSVTTDSRAAILTPSNGNSIRWRREDGETLNVSTSWQGDKLVQTFRADDGTRVNSYQMNPDGTMTMTVTITSGRLPRPLTYRLAFTKQ